MTLDELTVKAQGFFTDEIGAILATEDGNIFLEKDKSAAETHAFFTKSKLYKIEGTPTKSKKDK